MEAYLFLATLFGVSAYDFYLLKKSKVKISSCLWSSFITLLINFFILAFSVGFGTVLFGDESILPVIFGVLITLAISYFRFRGREVSGGKIKKQVVKEKKLSKKEKLREDVENVSTWGYVVAVLTTIFILFTINVGSPFTGGGEHFIFRLIDPIIIAGLAYWVSRKKTFVPCLLLTVVFIGGKLAMFIPLIQAGYTGGAGIGLSVIISYYLIKGTFSAYQYQKIK